MYIYESVCILYIFPLQVVRENFNVADHMEDKIEVALESESEDEGGNFHELSPPFKKRYRDIVSDMYRLGYI